MYEIYLCIFLNNFISIDYIFKCYLLDINYNYTFSNILSVHDILKFFDLKLLKALQYASLGKYSIPYYETCNTLKKKELGFKLTHNDRMILVLVLLRNKATKKGIIDLFFTWINQKHFNVGENVLFFGGCAKIYDSYQIRFKEMLDALIMSHHKQYTQQKYNSLFSQKKHIQLIQWLAWMKWLDANKTDGKLRK